MGRKKRARITVQEEDDPTHRSNAARQPESRSPGTLKANKAKDDAVAAANGERLRSAAQAGRLDQLEAALSKLGRGDEALDLADWGGWTALMHAASGDKPDLVELLLQKGASVDVTDNDGWTVLHVASLNGAIKCLPMLVEAGADPSTKEEDGRTAYDLAIEYGQEAAASLPGLRPGVEVEEPAAKRQKKGKGKSKQWVETGH